MRKEFERLAKIEVSSSEELWSWLAAHHRQGESVALVTYKKAVPDRYVGTDEVLDALIAHGWIDGARHKLDEERTMQLIGPRRTQRWTRSYKDRAARLEDEGRMAEAGRRAIAESKRLGLWNAMDDVDRLVVPEDLRAALDARPAAADFFDRAAPSYRRNVLRWIKLAKRPATRRRRIDRTVDLSAERTKVPQL